MRSERQQVGGLVRNTWQYRLLQSPLDLMALVGAWRLAIELRLLLNPLMYLQFDRGAIERLAPPLSGILILWIVVLPLLAGNRRQTDPSIGARLLQVMERSLMGSALLVVGTFFSRQMGMDLSRSLVLLFAPLSFLSLLLAQYCGLLMVSAAERKWPHRERVAVLGHGQEARRIVNLVHNTWYGAFNLVGVILPEGATAAGFGNPVPVVGTAGQLAEVINRTRLNRIIVGDSELGPTEMDECVRIAGRMDVIMSRTLAPAPVDARMGVIELYGMQLLEIHPIVFSLRQQRVKRAFDVIAALTLLVLTSPFLILIAILIKVTSSGPVLYKSDRVGKGGRHFTFLKFRSMRNRGNEREGVEKLNRKSGHLFKIRDDPRVTAVGRFLRRYSLDELPQLVNVLRGEMSLVGPRPLPTCDLEPDGQSRAFSNWSEQRSKVLPGITGLWQVRGRSETSFEEMVELDSEYIREWSLTLDLKIMLETPVALITGRGAY